MREIDIGSRSGAVSSEVISCLARLAQTASIEASTRNLAEVDRYTEWLAPGTEVYIPWLPGAPFHHSLSVAVRLKQLGLQPVPHFAAKRLDSAQSAAAFLDALREEAGVRRILLIGGDTERAAGPYWNALAVMESGLLLQHGIQRIDVAAYPEGHPRVPASAIREALLKKLERSRALGFEVRVVTQFCFEGPAIVRWLQAARKDGLASAVRIGVAGPARVRSLLSYAARCGIGNSVRALWDGPVSLRGLLSTHGPEDVLACVGGALVADACLDPLELHVFSFGGFRMSAQWLRAVADGRFGELGERNARANAATA